MLSQEAILKEFASIIKNNTCYESSIVQDKDDVSFFQFKTRDYTIHV